MQSWIREKYKKQIQNFLITFFIFLVILGSVITFFFYFGQIKKVKVNSFDNLNNKEIEQIIQNYIKKQNIFGKNFLFLNQKKLEENLKNEDSSISKISIKRNIDASIDVLIYRQQPFFFSCNENFVIPCVIGNSDGEYYQELIDKNNLDKNIFEIITDEKNLTTPNPSLIKEGTGEVDSFVGNRFLSQEKFKLLQELKKYFDQKGMKVKKINVDALKVAKLYIDNYYINNSGFYVTISLDKSFVQTIEDLETLEKSVEFGNVLKNKNSNLQYLDLSFKDKVFYK
jgi:hypothetical protein